MPVLVRYNYLGFLKEAGAVFSTYQAGEVIEAENFPIYPVETVPTHSVPAPSSLQQEALDDEDPLQKLINWHQEQVFLNCLQHCLSPGMFFDDHKCDIKLPHQLFHDYFEAGCLASGITGGKEVLHRFFSSIFSEKDPGLKK